MFPEPDLIFWIAGLLFGGLGVILVVEIWDWVRARVRAWRSGESIGSTLAADGHWVYHEPDTELRRRSFHRIEPERRTWKQGPNKPDGEI